MPDGPPRYSALQRALALALALLLGASMPAAAGQPVSVELVLAVDVSVSVNDSEYALQMSGIANALRRPEVKRLITEQDEGVALTVMQWAGTATVEQVVPWRLLRTDADIEAMAHGIAVAPRAALSYYTAPAFGILGAMRLLERNGFDGAERKIDVSGDGRRNTGPPASAARTLAVAAGITVNGLAIETDDATLGDWYGREVIGGPGAFVMRVSSFEGFGDAMARKLYRELSPKLSRLDRTRLNDQAGLASARSSSVSGMRHDIPRGVTTYSGHGKSTGGE
ncbi:MAG: DUF1194 domain-containing protein [Hyphomicrobiales bacterium]